MYEEHFTEICRDNCSKCKAGACPCASICPLYKGEMAKFINKRYLTISPRPSDYKSISDMVEQWVDNFIKLSPALAGAIVVLELAQGIRPHFHCILDCKDNIKLTSTLFCWSQYHNVKLHAAFKEGLHYLFKDVDNTFSSTGLVPIYELDDFLRIKSERKQKRQEQLRSIRAAEIKSYNNEIPQWMRN